MLMMKTDSWVGIGWRPDGKCIQTSCSV